MHWGWLLFTTDCCAIIWVDSLGTENETGAALWSASTTQLPRPVPGLGHKGNRIPGQTPKPWWSFRILTQHTLPTHWTHLPQRRKSLTPFPMSDHWQHSGSIPPCPSRSISWQVEKKAWCTLPLHGEEFKPCGSWAVCTGPSPWY